MVKQFAYHGKTLEELKEMDVKEFAKLTNSRIRRSLLRGFTEPQKALLKKIDLVIEGKRKKPIKTHCRDIVIIPKMLGLTISVYSGKEFIPFTIQTEMLGMKLGEFVGTRKSVAHSSPGVGATKSSGAVSAK